MVKLKFIRIMAVILAASILTGCAGLGDWTYDDLPGRYEVWRFNGQTIRLCEVDDLNGYTADTVIDSYVTHVASTDDYIFAQQLPEKGADEEETSYYVVEVEDGTVNGPFELDEFEDFCAGIGVEEIEWIKMKK